MAAGAVALSLVGLLACGSGSGSGGVGSLPGPEDDQDPGPGYCPEDPVGAAAANCGSNGSNATPGGGTVGGNGSSGGGPTEFTCDATDTLEQCVEYVGSESDIARIMSECAYPSSTGRNCSNALCCMHTTNGLTSYTYGPNWDGVRCTEAQGTPCDDVN
jgi:hypothetical protein